MNLKAIETAGAVAKQLAPLTTDEQLQVLLFLTEMTRREVAEPEEQQPPTRGRARTIAIPADLITIKEAARLRGVQRQTIIQHVRKGNLRSHKAGGEVRVSRAELETIPASRGIRKPATKSQLPESNDDLVTLKDAALAAGISVGPVFNAMSAGKLKAHGTRAKRLVSKSELLALGIKPRAKRSKK